MISNQHGLNICHNSANQNFGNYNLNTQKLLWPCYAERIQKLLEEN